jgi:transposase-like protein
VENRKKVTLLNIIKNHVLTDSIIYSDKFASYQGLSHHHYIHKTVNHSYCFKTKSGVCTNGIESVWGKNKHLIIDIHKNTTTENLSGYLDLHSFIKDCEYQQVSPFMFLLTKILTIKHLDDIATQKKLNSDSGNYDVEKIVDKRNSNNIVEYLVKWVGYPSSDNTWLPKQNLNGCIGLIENFEKQLKNIQQKDVTNRSRKKKSRQK